MKRSYTSATTQSVGAPPSQKKSRGARIQRQPSMSRNATMVRTGKGFPKQLTMSHTYCDVLQKATGAAGVISAYQFRCNGMFDPDITSTGHQPYYFDQLTAVYNHFTVIGSRMKLRIVKSDTGSTPVTVGIFVNDDASVVPSLTGCLEHPSSVHTTVALQDPIATLTKSWSAKKTFGGSVLSNDNLQGSSSADPTEQSVYSIFVDSSAGATATTVTLDVTIEYIAVWDELKDIASS